MITGKRARYTETKNVGGTEVHLVCIESLSYTGVWEDGGWDVYLKDKKIGHFWGYPVAKNIQNLLDNPS
jgi:hypothetical protein